MTNELIEEREMLEEEYELDDELEPEMQGFMQGWKEAGVYDKEDKSDFFDEEE